MPNSRFLLLILMLASSARGGQPWETTELGWLPQASAKSLPREARPRLSPERFAIIQADGNYACATLSGWQ